MAHSWLYPPNFFRYRSVCRGRGSRVPGQNVGHAKADGQTRDGRRVVPLASWLRLLAFRYVGIGIGGIFWRESELAVFCSFGGNMNWRDFLPLWWESELVDFFSFMVGIWIGGIVFLFWLKSEFAVLLAGIFIYGKIETYLVCVCLLLLLVCKCV